MVDLFAMRCKACNIILTKADLDDELCKTCLTSVHDALSEFDEDEEDELCY